MEHGIGIFAEKVAALISWILLAPFFFVGLTLAKIGQRLSHRDPYPEEANEPELASLARLCVPFNRKNLGRLRALLDRLNLF